MNQQVFLNQQGQARKNIKTMGKAFSLRTTNKCENQPSDLEKDFLFYSGAKLNSVKKQLAIIFSTNTTIIIKIQISNLAKAQEKKSYIETRKTAKKIKQNGSKPFLVFFRKISQGQEVTFCVNHS